MLYEGTVQFRPVADLGGAAAPSLLLKEEKPAGQVK